MCVYDKSCTLIDRASVPITEGSTLFLEFPCKEIGAVLQNILGLVAAVIRVKLRQQLRVLIRVREREVTIYRHCNG